MEKKSIDFRKSQLEALRSLQEKGLISSVAEGIRIAVDRFLEGVKNSRKGKGEEQ